MAPRGGARGHADEGIGGTSRREGGGDGEVDPPQLVGAGDGNLSANDPSGSGGGHGCLTVAGGAGGRRGKKGFGESGFWAARWRLESLRRARSTATSDIIVRRRVGTKK